MEREARRDKPSKMQRESFRLRWFSSIQVGLHELETIKVYVEFIKEKEKEMKEKGKDTRRIINCITQSRLVYCFQCEQTRSARLDFKLEGKK